MNPHLDDAEASASCGDFFQQMGELKKALISDKKASECSRFEKLSLLISEGRDAVVEAIGHISQLQFYIKPMLHLAKNADRTRHTFDFTSGRGAC